MSKALKDSGVIVAIIIASVLVYWDSLKLRPGTYDPLGSGTMPRIVAGSIIALSLVALLQTFFGKPVPMLVAPGMPEEEDFERRPWLALAVAAFLVAYVVLIWLRLPFGLSSSLFMFVSTLGDPPLLARRGPACGGAVANLRLRPDLPVRHPLRRRSALMRWPVLTDGLERD